MLRLPATCGESKTLSKEKKIEDSPDASAGMLSGPVDSDKSFDECKIIPFSSNSVIEDMSFDIAHMRFELLVLT